MSITADKRRSIPKGEFGLPAERKYPVDTAPRARNAKARAAQQVGKSISPSQKAQIDRKANPVIARAGGNPAPVSGKPATGRGSKAEAKSASMGSSKPMPKPTRNPLGAGGSGGRSKMDKFFD